MHWNRIKWKARFGSALREVKRRIRIPIIYVKLCGSGKPCLLNSVVNTFLRDSITRFLTLGFFSWIRFPPAPVVHLDLQISPLIFEKIWNGPNAIIRGLGEDYSRKKPDLMTGLFFCYRFSQKIRTTLLPHLIHAKSYFLSICREYLNMV